MKNDNQWAVALLNGKNYKRVPSVRSTSLHRLDDGSVAVRYHNTDVVTLHTDGTSTLNSGGFKTVTTKARINEWTKAGLYQKDYVWYLRGGAPYYDGVRINADGTTFVDPR